MTEATSNAAEERTTRTGQVQSITRALTLMKVLADSQDGATLKQLAKSATLAPSTAHRLLTTLQSENFVRFDATAGVWRVGVGAFSVGSAFLRSRDIAATARPFLRRLMEESGETANIFLLTDDAAVCMAQIESRHVMRAITRVGGRAPLHCSGGGKALLSAMSSDRIAQIIARAGLKAYTPKTLTTSEALVAAITKARNAGFAIDDEEHAHGLRCVAAPIFDDTNALAAAVSLSGPTARISDDRLPVLGEMTRRIAQEISVEIGGSPRDLN